jgi:signal transduction histidine kinase/ActR/RegA family two-component response regulator
MGRANILFDTEAWGPALEKYGAVARLSVTLYDADEHIVCGPVPATTIAGMFEQHGVDPGLFAECVHACLAQSAAQRRPVVVSRSSGLAAVGASLRLDEQIVGAVVAGYAFVNFCDSVAISRLARETGMPFQPLWSAVRTQRPVLTRRLVEYGELLQVLGDALLRENALRRRSDETANQLTISAAVKEEFLAVLSHELRTPLTPILGWTSILKLQSDPKILHAAEVIERNATLQLRLVEDLLELTRTSQGKLALNLKMLCLSDPLLTAMDAVAESARNKDIALQFIDAPEPLCLTADGDRLQQVFRNVLVNALKFTPAGGSVTITLSREGEDAVVRVRDNGEGIAPDFLPLVFDMFKQQEQGTRRAHGGLGIGLALVKQLTEAHGGAAAVVSAGPGAGTEVTIRLPLAPGMAEAIPAATRPDAGQPLELRGFRILVVEDMEDALEMMCVRLEHFGAHVLTARDGVEALERLAGDEIDLILCDLRMPRMDGFEFMRELHGLGARTAPPVIAVSGLASNADHRATQAAGFTDHIDKPFDDARLLAAVGVAMARPPRRQA